MSSFISFPSTFGSLISQHKRLYIGPAKKKSAVWWLAEWAKQNTISGMDFHAKILFLWTTQWQNGLAVSNNPLRKSKKCERLMSLPEAIFSYSGSPKTLVQIHVPWQMLLSLLCTHGSCMQVTYMIEAESKQESARGWWLECSCSAHQGDDTYCRQISPYPWIRNSHRHLA